jgi:hypothetical protein
MVFAPNMELGHGIHQPSPSKQQKRITTSAYADLAVRTAWNTSISTWHKKKNGSFSLIRACHPCAGAMLIFSVLFLY